MVATVKRSAASSAILRRSSSPAAATAPTAEALKFFDWAFTSGGKMAEELDYIPMPDSVVKLIEKTWSAEIKS